MPPHAPPCRSRNSTPGSRSVPPWSGRHLRLLFHGGGVWAWPGAGRQAAEQAGKLDEIPANHAPDFAPVIHPTLRTGVEAMLAAAGAWLATGVAQP